jgi:hypothetical protein
MNAIALLQMKPGEFTEPARKNQQVNCTLEGGCGWKQPEMRENVWRGGGSEGGNDEEGRARGKSRRRCVLAW